MEAMAVGLPAVSSRLSGIPELVLANETGILVTPRDSQQLVEAFERLASDPELRRRMGQAGRARVLEEFDLRQNAAKLHRLLCERGGIAPAGHPEGKARTAPRGEWKRA